MFKLTIKLLGITLFLTLMIESGFSHGACSPQTANNLNTEWVGTSEPNGKVEFISVRLAENDGQLRLPLAGFTAKLTSLRIEGSRVHCEFSRDAFKVVLNGTITGDKIEGEAEAGGIKARIYLVRSKQVAPEILASYVGCHNLLEVPRDKPNEYVHLQRFVPGLFETMVDWTLRRTRSSGR